MPAVSLGRTAALPAVLFVAVALASTAVIRAADHQGVDVGLYQRNAEYLRDGLVPYRDFDVEYPPGSLAVFALPALVSSGERTYFWAFATLMALVGAVGVVITAATLRQLDRPNETTRRVLLLVALSPVVLGGVVLMRFDLVPAVLVAGATLLLLTDHRRTAALTLGAAVAVKLYPIALLPLVASWVWRRHGAREALLVSAFALGVVALAFLPFLVVAPERVAWSLWYQSSRPLQIESMGAGMLVLLNAALDIGLSTERSYGSFNLTGVAPVLTATVFSVVSVVVVLGLWAVFDRGTPSTERLTRYIAAVLVAIVAFGTVGSPQFLVWLLFPLALVSSRRGARAGACFAVAAIATAVSFPWLYSEEQDSVVASLAVLRGLALVAAVAVLVLPIDSSARAPSRMAR
jgi:Glycosyltransferase family 87